MASTAALFRAIKRTVTMLSAIPNCKFVHHRRHPFTQTSRGCPTSGSCGLPPAFSPYMTKVTPVTALIGCVNIFEPKHSAASPC
jgi:hypothetical protein